MFRIPNLQIGMSNTTTTTTSAAATSAVAREIVHEYPYLHDQTEMKIFPICK